MAYHIIFLQQSYVKDDSVGFNGEGCWTFDYDERKTYSTEDAAQAVITSFNSGTTRVDSNHIKVVKE